ncbi:1,4-alpha-glucan branching protein GlgB [Psychromicrobium lacuslunae]|uniref:1,4-alpha-glucan branching enzyme GlgB n=1 Tax=Psychromicrobium lacuslunae TaxID=1618207 RepID=A0A0D4C1R2_9MICC|nr:1,4-alpha-glucan branching protein GlgB [Psychromicrobium lacuslunae]AJT42607.1 glycogen branching protein [Psychromicrobium lacuslunae]
MAQLSPTIPELLASWLPGKRWFPAKNNQLRLSRAGGFRLEDPQGKVGLEVHLVAVHTADRVEVLQVPLSYREAPLADAEAHLLGTTEHSEFGKRWIYDAVHDPVFIAAWLDFLAKETILDDGAALAHSTAAFRASHQIGVTQRIRVISAEQSNSSVVIRNPELSVILKFFRVLATGTNPDIEVGSALTEAGSTESPSLHGWASGSWQNAAGQTVSGSLCVMHEFVAKAEDVWQLAVQRAKSTMEAAPNPETDSEVSSSAGFVSGDFSAEAAELGRVTARLHQTMRTALGESPLDDLQRESFLAALAQRIRWAWSQAHRAVGDYQGKVDAVLAALNDITDLPPLQRIHGDLHLGQLIRTEQPARWLVLDFEGEPLRPVAERSLPDVPLRDVVGLLRSIDYAAASAGLDEKTSSRWVAESSAAYLDGYRSIAGEDLPGAESALFPALWLDKALYEVVYELRNRPDWLPVPVAAVRRLFDATEEVQMENTPIQLDQESLARISEGSHHAPHAILGPHFDDNGRLTIRTLRHLAEQVSVLTTSGETPMRHEYGGIWVALIEPEEPGHAPDYRIKMSYSDEHEAVSDDPYRFLPTVGEVDLHLIGEGRHEELWNVLGAHLHSYPSVLGEVHGVSFAVWAPNAQAVRVKAEFNDWDGRQHAMRSLGSSGVWELFVPGATAGSRYKFEILSQAGDWHEKADPMAFGTEIPPLTASRVVESSYQFKDQDWMSARAERDPHNSPMSVYEVHLGSWRPGLSYQDLARELVEYVQWMGFTHVEFMPVAEHPFGGSWGYQVTSYFAPTSRFGHPDEFKHLIDALHQAGIGAIMDWVPAHFPKDEWALAKFDGGPLYEHSDPRLGEHPDWGTLIFDFGRSEVRNFLTANALYWLEVFHLDGLRVDAVASMLYLDYSRQEGEWSPNRHGGRENLEAISFLQEMSATAYKRSGGIVTIAEESTAFPGVTAPTDHGGLGFGLKWNMGWMHDSLAYISEDPINRSWHHGIATFSLVYAFTENFLLPISHDEVVHGKGSMLRKMPGDRWQQLANLRAFLAWQWAHPGKQLIFMGTEFGQEAEWSEQHGLDWWLADMPPHRGLQLMVKQLNEIYRNTSALWEQDNIGGGFEWINANDAEHNVLSFVRWDKAGHPLVCVVNFAGNPHHDYRLGLPFAGQWREVLNTDAEEYGGSGVGNGGSVAAVQEGWDSRPASATLSLPPLGALYLSPEN